MTMNKIERELLQIELIKEMDKKLDTILKAIGEGSKKKKVKK